MTDGTVSAQPTKRFFVSMLTRDIALEDAILDLLDNCIDGVVRTIAPKENDEKPYAGYHAHVTMTPEGFTIQDNCGGINRDTLVKAFRMGRIDPATTGAATVGMYGIGMKRAIFKLGTSSVVASRTTDFGFRVTISSKWMDDPDDWRLPVDDLPVDDPLATGTRITVNSLRDDVAARFDEKNDNFIEHFRSSLSAHFAIILGKGFEVKINGTSVDPSQFTLLAEADVAHDLKAKTPQLKPYVFNGVIDGVSVEIYAGLYRQLPTEQEIEQEEEVRATRDNAGWTIVCNDRVVVHNDKTRLTGWGEAGVPAFHGQFMSFGGVVVLRSSDLWKLPLTTTKRGLDASSNLFSVVKDYMREATKSFTSFTNKWKRNPQERTALYKTATPLSLSQLRTVTASYPMTATRKTENSTKFVPNLPVPPSDQSIVRISYTRDRSQFQKVALYLFDDASAQPREVGEASFDKLLSQASIG
ncbi:MAG TPA: ATP-binding protein [Devosia sp.]|uniref:ATP-binding protein n=1 Tax=Devosia sp. TaxID=1871048 RepID=UPI002DDCB423|nr:ATP-binding protein [Devosia sp.]HEV2517824.1 ATP-binding protein [Devosia sp.]